MPVERFYISGELQGELSLVGQELHHLNVLRGKVGEQIEIVNGLGSLAKATILSLSRKEATLQVTETSYLAVSDECLHLAVPLMRPNKLELIVEKCTELGADSFHVYLAEHSEKKQLSKHQKERLNHIAIAAMKQCGRLKLPEIFLHGSLRELGDLNLPIFFGDAASNSKTGFLEKILFITGPEKGFSNTELKFLNSCAESIALGPHILRAETAPIAASSIFCKKF